MPAPTWRPGDGDEWSPAGLDPVATLQTAGRGGALRWSAPPGRWHVALRASDADGARWFGPWSFESRAGVAILALPSPLRAGGGIELELGGTGRARLDFVSVDGRIVRRLAVDAGGSGHDRVVWDGLDAAGRRVAPGVYFVRLVHAGRTDVRRTVVLQ
jgi:hypothetical protein